MARRSSRKSYFEPWVAMRSKAWELAFRFGPIKVLGEQGVLDFDAAKHKAEQDADWIAWGSQMCDPAVCLSLEGSVSVMDDRGIIVTFRKNGFIPNESSLTHADLCNRACACVNAAAGIVDPERFIADVRSLLLACVQGECEDPHQDPRVVSLLARCVPPEECAGVGARA
jgi:hypothetical protein